MEQREHREFGVHGLNAQQTGLGDGLPRAGLQPQQQQPWQHGSRPLGGTRGREQDSRGWLQPEERRWREDWASEQEQDDANIEAAFAAGYLPSEQASQPPNSSGVQPPPAVPQRRQRGPAESGPHAAGHTAAIERPSERSTRNASGPAERTWLGQQAHSTSGSAKQRDVNHVPDAPQLLTFGQFELEPDYRRFADFTTEPTLPGPQHASPWQPAVQPSNCADQQRQEAHLGPTQWQGPRQNQSSHPGEHGNWQANSVSSASGMHGMPAARACDNRSVPDRQPFPPARHLSERGQGRGGRGWHTSSGPTQRSRLADAPVRPGRGAPYPDVQPNWRWGCPAMRPHNTSQQQQSLRRDAHQAPAGSRGGQYPNTSVPHHGPHPMPQHAGGNSDGPAVRGGGNAPMYPFGGTSAAPAERRDGARSPSHRMGSISFAASPFMEFVGHSYMAPGGPPPPPPIPPSGSWEAASQGHAQRHSIAEPAGRDAGPRNTDSQMRPAQPGPPPPPRSHGLQHGRGRGAHNAQYGQHRNTGSAVAPNHRLMAATQHQAPYRFVGGAFRSSEDAERLAESSSRTARSWNGHSAQAGSQANWSHGGQASADGWADLPMRGRQLDLNSRRPPLSPEQAAPPSRGRSRSTGSPSPSTPSSRESQRWQGQGQGGGRGRGRHSSSARFSPGWGRQGVQPVSRRSGLFLMDPRRSDPAAVAFRRTQEAMLEDAVEAMRINMADPYTHSAESDFEGHGDHCECGAALAEISDDDSADYDMDDIPGYTYENPSFESMLRHSRRMLANLPESAQGDEVDMYGAELHEAAMATMEEQDDLFAGMLGPRVRSVRGKPCARAVEEIPQRAVDLFNGRIPRPEVCALAGETAFVNGCLAALTGVDPAHPRITELLDVLKKASHKPSSRGSSAGSNNMKVYLAGLGHDGILTEA